MQGSMKRYYKESARQSISRRVDELRSSGYARTEIELVDMWGENPNIVWYYKYVLCGSPSEHPNLCKGCITIKRRGTPVAHVIKDLTHEEFVNIAERIVNTIE